MRASDEAQSIRRGFFDVGIRIVNESAERRLELAVAKAADNRQDQGEVFALCDRLAKKRRCLRTAANQKHSRDSSNIFVPGTKRADQDAARGVERRQPPHKIRNENPSRASKKHQANRNRATTIPALPSAASFSKSRDRV